jgi:hypothetical protein
MTYRPKTTRFIDEFGADIAAVAIKDRGHTVKVGEDNEEFVRIYVELHGYEYWSPCIIYDPDSFGCDSTQLKDDMEELCGDLGLEPMPENVEVIKARLIKAELWEVW